MTGYRPDIDGLRAFAVLPVVLFHASFPYMSGGYIGVDIFFVISGYLITSTLLSDHHAARYSVWLFYKRRIRRIAPALLTVLIVSLAAGFMLLDAKEMLALEKQVVATLGFSSNILFFRQTGYFDLSSDLKPLLHTWSLAVEEQFYIGFPILLSLLVRRGRWMQRVIVILLILSLSLSIWATVRAPTFNFFLPFTRAWELLAGAALALRLVPALERTTPREALSAMGLILIVVPVVLYSATTPFPGLAAVPPVLGAALLLHAAPGTMVGDLLERRALVWVGLLSYALYLWHWPVLVFARFVTLRPLSPVESAIAVVIAMAAAWISLVLIERPLRQRTQVSDRTLLTGVAIVSLIVAGVAITGIVTKGTWGGMVATSEAKSMITEAEHAGEVFQNDPCLVRNASLSRCRLGAAAEPTIVLWGDSHAAQYAGMLDTIAKREHVAIARFTKAGCPPIIGVLFLPINDFHRECPAFNKAAADAIAANRAIRTVIVAARWQGYVEGTDWIEENAPVGWRSRDGRESGRLIRASMTRMAAMLAARGGQLIIVGPTPLPPMSPSLCFRIATARQRSDLACRNFEASHAKAVALAARTMMFPQGSSIVWVDPTGVLCDRDCPTRHNGKLSYLDADHLAPAGAAQLDRAFTRALTTN